MSIDELLVARILSKSRSPYIREELNMKEIWRSFSKSQVLGGGLEFFQVPEAWRKLGIFSSPRNMKEYEEVWSNMKKYEEICGKYEIRILPIYGPWDLEKFRAHRLISGRGGGGDSQFPGLGVPHRKDMKHVKTRRSASVKILLTSCLSFNTQPGLQTASLPS